MQTSKGEGGGWIAYNKTYHCNVTSMRPSSAHLLNRDSSLYKHHVVTWPALLKGRLYLTAPNHHSDVNSTKLHLDTLLFTFKKKQLYVSSSKIVLSVSLINFGSVPCTVKFVTLANDVAERGAMIPEYAVRELINIHEGDWGLGWGGGRWGGSRGGM